MEIVRGLRWDGISLAFYYFLNTESFLLPAKNFLPLVGSEKARLMRPDFMLVELNRAQGGIRMRVLLGDLLPDLEPLHVESFVLPSLIYSNSPLGVAHQALFDEGFPQDGDATETRVLEVYFLLQDVLACLLKELVVERIFAGDNLVEHDPEGPDVDFLVVIEIHDHFRGLVGDCANLAAH